jgi:hypothetical protein
VVRTGSVLDGRGHWSLDGSRSWRFKGRQRGRSKWDEHFRRGLRLRTLGRFTFRLATVGNVGAISGILLPSAVHARLAFRLLALVADSHFANFIVIQRNLNRDAVHVRLVQLA